MPDPTHDARISPRLTFLAIALTVVCLVWAAYATVQNLTAPDSPWTVENAGDTWGLSCNGVAYAVNLPSYDDAINMEIMYDALYSGTCPDNAMHDWQSQTPAWSARDHSENP